MTSTATVDDTHKPALLTGTTTLKDDRAVAAIGAFNSVPLQAEIDGFPIPSQRAR